MKKKAMAIVALILVVCFLAVYILAYLPVSAAPSKAQIKNELSGVQAEKREILQKAQNKEVEISELQQEINTIQFDIDVYEDKIAQSEIELAEAEAKEQRQYEAMKLRLRVMYEDNNTTYINLLLNGDSLTDIVSNMELINQMVDYDQNMHEQLTDIRLEIAYRKEELENEKGILDERKAVVVEKQNVLKSEKAALDGMVAQLTTEESGLLAEIARIEAEERALQQTIISKSSHSATSQIVGNGKFGYPATSTTITSPYGYRIHPIYGTRKLHTGTDFPAGTGTAIFATYGGKVITAGWVSGYGNTVIIDHGGGVTSLYAHNSSLLVSVGQTVTKGQQIAKAGSTGNSTGPHCHFEVRVNGATTDPMNYLR